MIQLSSHGFKLALIEPSTFGLTNLNDPDYEDITIADNDTSIPKIEASYGFNAGPAKLTLFGLYNTFDVVDEANDEEGVDSYGLGFGFMMPFGAAYLNGNIWMAQNADNGSLFLLQNTNSGPAWDGTEIVDNDTIGYMLVAGFKMSDAITFEFGYGHTESELDISGYEADEVESYYANATINIAKGFFVVPEIGKVDYKKDMVGDDQGDTTYFGAKWQVNF